MMDALISAAVAVGTSLLTGLVGHAFVAGRATSRFERMEKEIEELKANAKAAEQHGTAYSQTTRLIVDMHTKDIDALKTEQRKISETVAEIRGDVRAIAEWVREQKQKPQ